MESDLEKIRTITSGANQSGLRAHNERLLMSLLHRYGDMPGRDMARLTGLSPQTVSVILRKLETDGLVRRGTPVAGKVGKPSVPIQLVSDGVLAYGLKIGRRSAELLLLDMRGNVRSQRRLQYPYPIPATVFGFVQKGLAEIDATLTPALRQRVCGLGIAVPFEMWNWHELIGAPAADIAAWREVDLQTACAAFTDLPVFTSNDATAACRAEHMFGRGKEFRDYFYFYLGLFIGGGVVLDHAVFEGHTGNAGALGAMPCPAGPGRNRQLVDVASIHVLERRLQEAGLSAARLWAPDQDWSEFSDLVAPWIEETGAEIARASVAAASVIDFEAILIDGALPEDVRSAIVASVEQHMRLIDTRGIKPPRIVAGTIGANARAIGAASTPIISQFLIDRGGGFAGSAPAT